MPTKVYLAGPMTGFPQFNIPAFDAAAKDLRSRGLEVVSPAELDDPETRAAALASKDGLALNKDESWGDFLARDVKLIADDGIEAIVVLPGWMYSPGALLETYVARLSHLPIYSYAGHAPLYGVRGVDLDAAHTSERAAYDYVLFIP